MSSFNCSLVAKMLMVIFLAFIMSCHAPPKDDILLQGKINECIAQIKNVFKIKDNELESSYSHLCVRYAIAGLHPTDELLNSREYVKNYYETLKPTILDQANHIVPVKNYTSKSWMSVGSTSDYVPPEVSQRQLNEVFKDMNKTEILEYMFNNNMISSRSDIVKQYTSYNATIIAGKIHNNVASPQAFCTEYVKNQQQQE